jgi:hypothetical protein
MYKIIFFPINMRDTGMKCKKVQQLSSGSLPLFFCVPPVEHIFGNWSKMGSGPLRATPSK